VDNYKKNLNKKQKHFFPDFRVGFMAGEVRQSFSEGGSRKLSTLEPKAFLLKHKTKIRPFLRGGI
jgi:hypothetical protein